MRIVYCTDSIRYLGGIQRVTVTKANALAAIPGNEVWIVVTDNREGILATPLSPHVRLVDLKVDYYADDQISKLHVLKGIFIKRHRHRKLLARLLAVIKPDVVIATGTSEKYFIPGIAQGAATIREIHFNTGYRMEHARKSGSLFDLVSARVADFIDYRFGIKRYDRLALLTREDRDDNWSGYGRAVVMPNPLTFKAADTAALDNREIAATGRLVELKDFTTLLRVVRKVFDRHPDWHLTIYGEGDERPILERLITELRLKNNVTLAGAVTDIPSRLRESSIYAVSSRFEGFHLGLIEAMEAGVPPVSFACKCGPRDIITDGKDGFLVTPGDTDTFADRICTLIEDRTLRQNMGAAAKRRAADFSIEKITGQWMSLFEEVIKEKRDSKG